MLSLSHYSFRERLEYQCKKYGCNLKVVDEAYTSKTCSECGIQTDVGKSKVFNCSNPKCKFICDRDINASINIYKK